MKIPTSNLQETLVFEFGLIERTDQMIWGEKMIILGECLTRIDVEIN